MENPIWTARYRSRSNTLTELQKIVRQSFIALLIRPLPRENYKMSANEVIPRRSLNSDAIAAKITVFYRVSHISLCDSTLMGR